MDTNRLRQLLDKRDALDVEIQELVNGNTHKKVVNCSLCDEAGHTARTCPSKGRKVPATLNDDENGAVPQ